MKKYLLPENKLVLKANLHCHSTCSEDGRLTPAQIKELYMQKGYSVIAFTDHNKLFYHQDLTDDKFVAIDGYEINIDEHIEGVPYELCRTIHFCLLCKKPGLPPLEFDWVYDPDNINKIFRQAKEAGYFITYNHPTLSNERYPSYSKYEGMDAMEIWNTGSYCEFFDEYNCHAYQDFLCEGKRIFCIAADDNHHKHPAPSPLSDAFGGWVMLYADRLDYASVTAALERGDFYASCGPEIKELYIEDGCVHVKTSPAHAIHFITDGRRHHGGVHANYGESVSEAVFELNPGHATFFRIDVIDDYGRHANTNGYFLDTLGIEFE